jgi:tetratricopeptide (TPR) repeat protein
LLLFAVFQRATSSLWRSFFVAALFALHPVNVDTVAWIAERKNVLSTFFWMLTMLTYVYYTEKPAAFRYLLMVIVFILGLLSKPMLVTLPFVLLLLDYWPLKRFVQGRILQIIGEKLVLFVLACGSMYLSSVSFKNPPYLPTAPMGLRIANALVSYIKYVLKLAWPTDLAVLYPYPANVPLWQTVGALVLLILGFATVVRFYSRLPYLVTGWLWYVGTLVPVSGLVQIGLWPEMADRWAYVPFIGLFIIIVWGIGDLFNRWQSRFIGALGMLGISWLLILGILTSIQLRYWHSSVMLFEHTLAVTKNNYVIHRVLGCSLQSQNKLNEAIAQYRQAIQIRPNYAEAQHDLGYALCKQGKWDEALVHLRKAVQLNPRYADAQHNLGFVLYTLGRLNEASVHLGLAIKLKPDYPQAYYNLGNILSAQSKPDEAIACYRKAIQLKPDYANAHNNLGIALKSQGRLDEAINHFRSALNINPGLGEAYYNLAGTLRSQGKLDEAIKCYERVAELTKFQDVAVLETLAAAYAAAGQFDRAVNVTQTAIDLASAAKNTELADNLRRQLDSYKQSKP